MGVHTTPNEQNYPWKRSSVCLKRTKCEFILKQGFSRSRSGLKGKSIWTHCPHTSLILILDMQWYDVIKSELITLKKSFNLMSKSVSVKYDKLLHFYSNPGPTLRFNHGSDGQSVHAGRNADKYLTNECLGQLLCLITPYVLRFGQLTEGRKYHFLH